MLQVIRERVTGIVAIFVLGLLAIPFLFFGLDSYMGGGVSQNAIATVGGTDISASEFETSFAQYRARLRDQLGDRYSDIDTNQPAVRREHLEQMIDQVLLRQYAEDLGLRVSDRAVAEIIRGIPAFQIEGQFNPDVYQQALRGAGETPRSFERDLRDDIQTSLVPQAVSESAVVTETEIDRMISLQGQTRQVSFIQIDAAQFEQQVEVTEADIETYYEENLDSFTSEERVRLAYVELQPEALVEEASLSEEELRQRYEAAKQRYMTPEARRASHILIASGEAGDETSAQARAEELQERIADGESFEELAAEYSDDPVSAEQGGDLGWIEPEDMVGAFEDALYDLSDPGDVSEPVETQFGWHLIRLDEIRPPEGMSFEEARQEILDEQLQRQREELYIELSERMVDLVYADDSSLEPLADELDLEIKETDWFSRSGAEDGIASNEEVAEAAFSDLVLLDEAVSDPIEIDRNHMVAVRVIEHEPAEPRPLEEVSDQIRQRLITERTREMARERGESLREQIVSGEATLESLAEAEDLELVSVESLGRRDFQQGPGFVREVFQLSAPGEEPSLHVLARQGGQALVRLEGVQPGNPAEAGESEREMVRRQLRTSRTQEAIEGLLARLREETRISVDEERL
ncbi:SurA N-terminal domain-containing protein [Wenzhouxiangella sp. EGI_FJ10305]|uniref:SurA N-terminal domain-containing protein n=1 Tax=Wenzhouxiangella sp. EGI_FJ10305 TaxID=3243768 RepID=UPI0035DA041A